MRRIVRVWADGSSEYEEHKGSFLSLCRNLSPQQPGCPANAQLAPVMNVGNVVINPI